MSIFPVPDIIKRDIYEIEPRLFLDRGVCFVFLDVDNTLAPYRNDTATRRLLDWCAEMRRAGLELFILSNNRGRRPELFAKQLGIGFEAAANKPFTRKLRAILAEKGLRPSQAALVGDQIFTDVLCARNAGILSVLVRPVDVTNPFHALRYALETPFRKIRVWKNRNIKK